MLSIRENFLRKLVLRVDAAEVQAGAWAELRKFLQPDAPMKCAVTVEYRTPQAQGELRLGGQWGVALDDANLRDLRVALGRENVSLVF